ncbi:MAG TPA: hypothetical protein VGJ97_11750 [Anaerolineaceae bacterium]
MEDELDLPKKKRGGQVGNVNAVKHGVYTRWYRQLEHAELDALAEQDLQKEISMLRVVLQRFFEIVSQESPDLETMSKALTALGKGSAHLSRLIYAEKSLSGEPEDGAAALSKALASVIGEIER